jgi:hypothetical protein
MDTIQPIDVIDTDGAFAGAYEEATGITRGQLLKRTGAAAAGAGLLFAGLPQTAGAASTATDLKILAFALVAEQLGSAYYTEAVAAGRLEGETLLYARTAKRDEDAHVVAVSDLIKAKGGTPAPAPRFDFKGIPADPQRFRVTALEIETMCVRVLNGAGPLVSKDVLAAAGALVSVEARQVAWISSILDRTPAPSAYDKPLSLAAAQRRVAATGFIQGA